MKIKAIIAFIFFISLIILNSCEDNPVKSNLRGLYFFSGFDSKGVAIAEGWLTLELTDSTNISGEWNINEIDNSQNFEYFEGKGDLVGGKNNDEIWVELYPDFVDNNLHLLGRLNNNNFSGNWARITFHGVVNHGTFICDKHND